jgi:hypothetical protein
LGARVRKEGENYTILSSFKNPTRKEENVYVFPDAPHLLKLLRDNLFKHGLVLENGVFLRKCDFETLLKMDSEEMQANYKLQAKHLDVKGLQKTRVSLAVQLFSNTTAALWRKVFPNRRIESEFIQIFNDWFDLMNSRTIKEPQTSKKPFGLDINNQYELLEKMEQVVLKLRVGSAKHLYPFQRGILQSIYSIKGLFHDLAGSSLRITYILTHRLNQDIAENAFSVIRKTGEFHTKPSAVDAKNRLKLLCLSYGGNSFKTSAVQGDNEDEPYLSARMMGSLVSNATTSDDPAIVEISTIVPAVSRVTEENIGRAMNSMRMERICEEGGNAF